MADVSLERPSSDRSFFIFNALLSTGALALLAYLLLIRHGSTSSGLDLRFMPAVNASFNALSAAMLVSGYVAIRNRRSDIHRYFMVSAFASSALFLVGYLSYHYVHGDTKYQGGFRPLYLVILASHVLLSMVVVPGALSAFYFAWKKRFATHKQVTRVLFPIWLYVSVTGVIIFFMLRGSMTAH
ncbi:MAG: DUF420 domain-containing protein [Myxococcaceae bacterium]